MRKSRSNSASDWQTLAVTLDITPRSLRRVRDRFAGHPDLPKPGRNGSHSIDEWRSFFEVHDVNANAASRSDEVTSWRGRLIEQQVIRATLANELTRRQQVPMSEVQTKLSAFLMAIRTQLDQLVPDLAQALEGIDDYHEREEIIQDRIDKMLLALQSAPWLDETPLEFEGE